MNFIVNLDKPKGMTSQQAVAKLKRMLGVKKAGHTGTLDPMATGVLLVCLNEATKVARFFLDQDKVYSLRMKLGERTDTFDADGTVTETAYVPEVSADDILSVTRQFTGRITQMPPMYSAIKIKGRPLYELARKGLEVERPERQIEIYSIRTDSINLPYIDMEVSCSKGTYVRTLCDDIGVRLGTYAHLVALRRTGIGRISIDSSASFEILQQGFSCDAPYIFSIDEALSEMPDVMLCEYDYSRAKNGVALGRDVAQGLHDSAFVKLRNPEGKLFGIASVEQTKIAVERILNL